MKIKKLIEKLNKAELEHNIEKCKKLWLKAIKKSLNHKHTEPIQ